jgi:hypothetical protein
MYAYVYVYIYTYICRRWYVCTYVYPCVHAHNTCMHAYTRASSIVEDGRTGGRADGTRGRTQGGEATNGCAPGEAISPFN